MARIIHCCISVPNITKSLTTVTKIPFRTKIRLKDITWLYLSIFRVCSPPFLLNDWEEPQQSHQGSPLVPISGQTVQDSVPVDAGWPVLKKTSEMRCPQAKFSTASLFLLLHGVSPSLSCIIPAAVQPCCLLLHPAEDKSLENRYNLPPCKQWARFSGVFEPECPTQTCGWAPLEFSASTQRHIALYLTHCHLPPHHALIYTSRPSLQSSFLP